ncbi:MAG: 6-phosphofructokinase [Phycisphaerales bacterium]|nr:6-phosphofructokinase [Phycisphaerales bacterium]
MQGNAVIGQSGGPTAVINQSLVGVIEGLRGTSGLEQVLGMRHGVRGLTTDQLTRLDTIAQPQLDLIAATPSAALGSTRDKPDAAYCERILAGCKKHNVRWFFYIGGNDSSDTCRIVNDLARSSNYDMHCFHVPKTIDNDLMKNDHTPGYASAARYVAKAFMGDNLDNASIPGIKINVVMGRHAGFLTAAAALGRAHADDGPHIVCLPERTFDMDAFTARVEQCVKQFGRCQIALSEGVQDKDGNAIGATLIKGETDAHGNVQLSGSGALGDQMAEVLKKRLTPAGGKAPRVRADTLGYPQRCYPDASPIDQSEARAAGRFAAELAKKGERDGSIAIVRKSDAPYASDTVRVELTDVAAKTRHMPDDFLDGDFNVSKKFINWLTPLVGNMPKMGRVS